MRINCEKQCVLYVFRYNDMFKISVRITNFWQCTKSEFLYKPIVKTLSQLCVD